MDETDYVHIMPDDGGRMQQAGNHSGTGRAGEGLFRPPEPPELGSPGESPYCETSPETTVDGYVHLLHERTLQRRFRADASISRIKEWHAAIEKYIPNDGSVTFLPVDDNRVDVIIPMPSDFYEKSLEELIAMKEEWKESLPIIESKKKKREEREIQQQVPQFMRISDIYRYIVALPIDELSPRDALDTLRDVRKRLIALF